MEPFFSAAVEKGLEKAAEEAVKKAFSTGIRSAKWLPTTCIHRNSRLRMSYSAFIRIRNDDGHYMLIRNYHRPEFFGPIGGCFKYQVGKSQRFLDQIGYIQDSAIASKDTRRDIRGFVLRKNTLKLINWFIKNENEARESARECIRREMIEELTIENEVINPQLLEYAELDFQHIRSFLEKSRLESGELNFRYFSIYDLVLNGSDAELLRSALIASTHENILWAEAEDLERGRTKNKLVIGHAGVLFIRDRLTRPDLPHYRR